MPSQISKFIKVIKSEAPLSSAWSGVILAAAFNYIGMFINHYANSAYPDAPIVPSVISFCVGLVIFLYMVFRKSRASHLSAAVLFIINVCFVCMALFISDRYLARTATHWFPFQANKLGCFVSALLCPSYITGFISIGLHTLTALANLWTMRENIAVQIDYVEPWAMIAFAIAGIFTMTFRFYRIELERQIINSNHTNEFMRRYAETVVQL